MPYNRTELMDKVRGFLDGEIPQAKIYEWALSQVVDENYEELAQGDALLAETTQALIDINHDDVENAPSQKDLEYYLRCLEGTEQFVSLRNKKKTGASKQKRKVNKADRKRDIFLSFRIYVALFAASILAINIFGIINPNFLRFGLEPLSDMDVLQEAIPHIIYGIFLLLPMRLLAGKLVFPVSLLILFIGAVFYWYISFSIVMGLSINMLVVLVVLPFGGIPAVLALLLLLKEKKMIFH